MQPDLQLLVQGTQGPKQGRGKAIGRPKARYQKQRERASDQQDRPSPLRLLSFPCSSKPPQNSSCFFRTSVPAPVVWVPSPLQPNPDDSSRYYESTKGSRADRAVSSVFWGRRPPKSPDRLRRLLSRLRYFSYFSDLLGAVSVRAGATQHSRLLAQRLSLLISSVIRLAMIPLERLERDALSELLTWWQSATPLHLRSTQQ